MMKKPTPLRPGDKVAITAASSPVKPDSLAAGKKILESLGLRVRITESCYATHEYLAGTDELRLRCLHDVFADKSIRGIFLARGGYGAARLLPHIDFELIRRNPKIFAGYSDVTALHNAINQFAHLVTYHAPMPAADLPNSDDVTMESFVGKIFLEKKSSLAGDWGQRTQPLQVIAPGKASGILTGGNLTVIASLIGTPYEIDTRGRILFLEEVGEAPYRIDRLLLQLKLAGKLSDAAGFILGDINTGDTSAKPIILSKPECVRRTAETGDTSAPESILSKPGGILLTKIKLAISELLISEIPEGKPILAGLACGHTMPNITLPLGEVAKISTESLHPLQICDHY